jgi:hypothetical protein
MIRESTRLGNDKKARNIESAHRTRMAEQQTETRAARVRLDCVEVLACHECEKLFNADKAVRKDQHVFFAVRSVRPVGEKHALCLL